MSAVFKEVIKNIGELSSDEKAFVARCLISSLETRHDDSVDQAWGKLSERRYLELMSGSVKSHTWEEIKKEITN